ncbi:MAG: hypothetical protein ACI9FG_000537 [Crocinitomicaceae bacterium]|jgi:hypothetical protein
MRTRRTFIKNSAVTLSSLFAMSKMSALQASITSGQSGNQVTPRFIFLRKSNGTSPEWLTPPTLKDSGKAQEISLDTHDLPDWMAPLTDHKSNLTILQGLSAKMCAMGHSTYQSPLGVCRSAERIGTISRATVDVELGKLMPSPFGHLEFTCAKNAKGVVRGMSAFGPKQPNFAFATPATAYQNLFVQASSDKKSQIRNTLNSKMYDYIHKHIKPNTTGVNNAIEIKKIDDYALSVEALIKRNEQLVSMSDQIKKHAPTMSKEMMADEYTVLEQQAAFVDVILASLYAGLSNVVTFTLDTLGTDYSGLVNGGNVDLHDVGHGKPFQGVEALAIRNKLRTHHMTLIDGLVKGLKSMPEGSGTMFDNTVIMYLPENGEKHHSIGTEVPFVILSGDKVKLDIGQGHYIRLPGYDNKGHKTLGNWYTTLLNAYGNPIEHYGDLDISLNINQEGPIQQFML